MPDYAAHAVRERRLQPASGTCTAVWLDWLRVHHSRLSLAFFALSSLELLGKIDELDAQARAGYIDWIYAQQVKNGHAAGFRGGPHVGLSVGLLPVQPIYLLINLLQNSSAEPAHIAMTYTAILCLGILRDDFTRFDISGTINFVNACQAIDGR